MHLKKVILNNFRCFKHLEIDLHPRLTVLVAENGGGKTAILDGIAIGLAPVLRYLSSANQRLNGPGIKDDDFRISTDNTPPGVEEPDFFPELSGISGKKSSASASDYVQVCVETVSGLKWDNWRGASEGKQPESKIGQSELMTFASKLLESLKSSERNPLPVFAYYGAKRGWIVIPKRLRESKENYEHPTSALIGALESHSEFAEMLKWFDTEEAAELRASRQAQEYQESPMLSGVRSAISSILGRKYTYPHFDRRHKFVIESDGDIGTLQISQLSQGYQSMLALGMDFSRRLELANSHLHMFEDEAMHNYATSYIERWGPHSEDIASIGPAWAPAIMLVDEIDLHLHPSWQQRVLDDLMRAFPCTQFIVTTHSPQVLSTVDKESIRLIRLEADQSFLETPKFQTRGVESADVLTTIMGVDPAPKVPESILLSEYRALIENGNHDREDGQNIRAKLIAHFGESHPLIRDCDRLIRFQTFKRDANHATKPD